MADNSKILLLIHTAMIDQTLKAVGLQKEAVKLFSVGRENKQQKGLGPEKAWSQIAHQQMT